MQKAHEKMERERISEYAGMKSIFPKLAIRKVASPKVAGLNQ